MDSVKLVRVVPVPTLRICVVGRGSPNFLVEGVRLVNTTTIQGRTFTRFETPHVFFCAAENNIAVRSVPAPHIPAATAPPQVDT